MAVNTSRSMTRGLHEGMTDGAYHKANEDREPTEMTSVMARSTLHDDTMNAIRESPVKHLPDGSGLME